MPIYNTNLILLYMQVVIILSQSPLELGSLAIAIREVIHVFFGC